MGKEVMGFSTTLKEKPFENFVEKRRKNADNQQFLLFFHNVFYPSKNEFHFFSHIYFHRLQMLLIWTFLNVSFRKELNNEILQI